MIPKAKKLFISYRSSDAPKVDKMARDLGLLLYEDSTPRYITWQDKHNLPPASPHWWDAIVDAIDACDVFVFHMSRESLQSVVCLAELDYAHNRNRPIIPVVLEGQFFLDSNSGRYNIAYWELVPDWLGEQQFLFYTGADFFLHFQQAIEMFERNWPRDVYAPRPLNPDNKSVHGSNHALYDAACDYAERLAFEDARKHFSALVRRNDKDYADVAAQWLQLIHLYIELIEIDERKNAHFIFKDKWSAYQALYPKVFLNGIFDPRNFSRSVEAGDGQLLIEPLSSSLVDSPNLPTTKQTDVQAEVKKSKDKHKENHLLHKPEVLRYEPEPLTSEEFARLQKAGQIYIDDEGRVRTDNITDSIGVSFLKNRVFSRLLKNTMKIRIILLLAVIVGIVLIAFFLLYGIFPILEHTLTPTPFQQFHLLPLEGASFWDEDGTLGLLVEDGRLEHREFLSIPFEIGRGISTFGCIDGSTDKIELTTNVFNPTTVFFLIQAGNASSHYAGLKLGSIRLYFSDGRSLTEELIIGHNIRDWARNFPGSVTTVTSDQAVEAWRGFAPNGREGGIDMLTIRVPETYLGATLTNLEISDTSDDAEISNNLCIHLTAVTVEAGS